MAIIHDRLYPLVTLPTWLLRAPTFADMANKWEKVVTLLARTSSNREAFRYVSNKPAKFGYPCIRHLQGRRVLLLPGCWQARFGGPADVVTGAAQYVQICDRSDPMGDTL